MIPLEGSHLGEGGLPQSLRLHGWLRQMDVLVALKSTLLGE